MKIAPGRSRQRIFATTPFLPHPTELPTVPLSNRAIDYRCSRDLGVCFKFKISA